MNIIGGIVSFMSKPKQRKVERLQELFQKKKVLKTEDLAKVLATNSRTTIHRYLKEMRCLTSYSHSGRFYTLTEIAKFDESGLWHYGDIGFSKYGTLLATIVHFVSQSSDGLTNNALQQRCQVKVKDALIDLMRENKLIREKHAKRYVYLSTDSIKARDQLKKHKKAAAKLLVDDSTALRVLLAAYQLFKTAPTPEQVMDVLKKDGSKISLEIVQQVFQNYELGKKTLDFDSFQS